METKIELAKKFISKYVIHIVVLLIIIVLIFLLIPNKITNNENNTTKSYPTIVLNGSYNFTLLKGEKYVDPGYIAYDEIDGNITDKVVVENYVNTSIVGNYIVKYKVTNSLGISFEIFRHVSVVINDYNLTVNVEYEPKTFTAGEVTLRVRIDGNGFESMIDPKGNTIKTSTLTYKVYNNGTYDFIIKKKDGSELIKSITISNIDKTKPIGSCTNTIKNSKSVISVTATDESGIKKYTYNIEEQKIDSSLTNYSVGKIVTNASVTIYDNANNYTTINCSNVNNDWPEKITPTIYSGSAPKNYFQNLKFKSLNYILYYPDNLNLNSKNALVIFLHGVGECGSNILNSFNQNTAFVNNMKSGKFQGAIFIAPQCNCKNGWRGCMSDLKDLIDDIVKNYNVDQKRISITGHSLGGSGTYIALSTYPDLFSVGVVLSSGLPTIDYNNLLKNKIVVFYGTLDSNYEAGKRDANSLINMGANLKFYDLSGQGHIIQSSVYNGTNTIEWMISQSK